MTTLDVDAVNAVVDRHWDEALPVLEDYIRIPAKSPTFDPDWAANGHIDAAVALVETWCRNHAPEGAAVWVHELDSRTPVVVVEVDACPVLDAHASRP